MIKFVYDTNANLMHEIKLTSVDIEKIQYEYEQQELLSLLIPSQNEIEQAEFELKTITLLMEVGLL